MTEFSPDYSSPEALRASYLEHAKTMRKAASESVSAVGSEAFTAEAEAAEASAEDLANA